MPADEYAAWQETAYLFRSPANARRLLDAWVRLVSDRSAWDDHTHWQTTDREVLTRITTPIDAGLRDPFEGIGKPGQLNYGAAGAWSWRITEERRLVYLVDGEDLIILQVRYDY